MSSKIAAREAMALHQGTNLLALCGDRPEETKRRNSLYNQLRRIKEQLPEGCDREISSQEIFGLPQREEYSFAEEAYNAKTKRPIDASLLFNTVRRLARYAIFIKPKGFLAYLLPEETFLKRGGLSPSHSLTPYTTHTSNPISRMSEEPVPSQHQSMHLSLSYQDPQDLEYQTPSIIGIRRQAASTKVFKTRR